MLKIKHITQTIRHPVFLTVFCAFVWGGSAMLYKTGSGIASGQNMAFLRLFLAGSFLFLFCKIKKKKIFDKKTFFYTFAIALLNSALPFALIGQASTIIDTGIVAILNATMPVFTFILSIFFLNQKISTRSFVAIFISTAGIIMIYCNVFYSNISINFYGIFLVLLANFFYAASTIIISKKLNTVDSIAISASSLSLGALILFPVFITTFNFNAFLNLKFVISMLLLALVGTSLTYVIYFSIIKQYGANFASLNAFLVPVAGCFYGFIFYSERITILKIIGTLAIIVGMFLIKTRDSKM